MSCSPRGQPQVKDPFELSQYAARGLPSAVMAQNTGLAARVLAGVTTRGKQRMAGVTKDVASGITPFALVDVRAAEAITLPPAARTQSTLRREHFRSYPTVATVSFSKKEIRCSLMATTTETYRALLTERRWVRLRLGFLLGWEPLTVQDSGVMVWRANVSGWG